MDASHNTQKMPEIPSSRRRRRSTMDTDVTFPVSNVSHTPKNNHSSRNNPTRNPVGTADLAAVLLEQNVIAPYSMYKICKLQNTGSTTTTTTTNTNNNNSSSSGGGGNDGLDKNGMDTVQRQEAELLYVIFQKFCTPHPTVEQLLRCLRYCQVLLLSLSSLSSHNNNASRNNHSSSSAKEEGNSNSVTLPNDIVLHTNGTDAVIRMLHPNVLLHPLLCRQHKGFQLTFLYVLLRLLSGDDSLELEEYMKTQVLYLNMEDLDVNWIMSDLDLVKNHASGDSMTRKNSQVRLSLEQTLQRVANANSNAPNRISAHRTSSAGSTSSQSAHKNRQQHSRNESSYYTTLRFLSGAEWTASISDSELQCRGIERKAEFGIQRLLFGNCAQFDLQCTATTYLPTNESGQGIRRTISELSFASDAGGAQRFTTASVDEVGMLGLLLGFQPAKADPMTYERHGTGFDKRSEHQNTKSDNIVGDEIDEEDDSGSSSSLSDVIYRRRSSTGTNMSNPSNNAVFDVYSTAHLIAPLCAIVAICARTGHVNANQLQKVLEILQLPYYKNATLNYNNTSTTEADNRSTGISNATNNNTIIGTPSIGPISKLHLLHILHHTISPRPFTPTPYTPSHCFQCNGSADGIRSVYDANNGKCDTFLGIRSSGSGNIEVEGRSSSRHLLRQNSSNRGLGGSTRGSSFRSSGGTDHPTHNRSSSGAGSGAFIAPASAPIFNNEYAFATYFRAECFPTPTNSNTNAGSAAQIPILFQIKRYANSRKHLSDSYAIGIQLSLETIPQYSGPAVATLVLRVLDGTNDDTPSNIHSSSNTNAVGGVGGTTRGLLRGHKKSSDTATTNTNSSNSGTSLIVRDGAGNIREGQSCVRMTCCVVTPKVWHHVAVRHVRAQTRSAFRNFFSKNTTSDELIIYFDHRPLLRTNLKYPKYLPSDTPLPSNSPNTASTGGSGLYEVHIGKYWDGQLSGVCMSHGLDAGSSIGAGSSSASSVGGFIDDPFLNAVLKEYPIHHPMTASTPAQQPVSSCNISVRDALHSLPTSFKVSSSSLSGVREDSNDTIYHPYTSNSALHTAYPISTSSINSSTLHTLLRYTPRHTKYLTSAADGNVLCVDIPLTLSATSLYNTYQTVNSNSGTFGNIQTLLHHPHVHSAAAAGGGGSLSISAAATTAATTATNVLSTTLSSTLNVGTNARGSTSGSTAGGSTSRLSALGPWHGVLYDGSVIGVGDAGPSGGGAEGVLECLGGIRALLEGIVSVNMIFPNYNNNITNTNSSGNVTSSNRKQPLSTNTNTSISTLAMYTLPSILRICRTLLRSNARECVRCQMFPRLHTLLTACSNSSNHKANSSGGSTSCVNDPLNTSSNTIDYPTSISAYSMLHTNVHYANVVFDTIVSLSILSSDTNTNNASMGSVGASASAQLQYEQLMLCGTWILPQCVLLDDSTRTTIAQKSGISSANNTQSSATQASSPPSVDRMNSVSDILLSSAIFFEALHTWSEMTTAQCLTLQQQHHQHHQHQQQKHKYQKSGAKFTGVAGGGDNMWCSSWIQMVPMVLVLIDTLTRDTITTPATTTTNTSTSASANTRDSSGGSTNTSAYTTGSGRSMYGTVAQKQHRRYILDVLFGILQNILLMHYHPHNHCNTTIISTNTNTSISANTSTGNGTYHGIPKAATASDSRTSSEGIISLMHMIGTYALCIQNYDVQIPHSAQHQQGTNEDDVRIAWMKRTLCQMLRILLHLLQICTPNTTNSKSFLYGTLTHMCYDTSTVLPEYEDATSSLHSNSFVSSASSSLVVVGASGSFLSFIICSILHQPCDTLRSLGIRIMTTYITNYPSVNYGTAPTSSSIPTTVDPSSTSTSIANRNTSVSSSTITHSGTSTSSTTNINANVNANGTSGALTTRPLNNLRMVYKLAWHMLQLHTSSYAESTYTALLELLLVLHTNSTTISTNSTSMNTNESMNGNGTERGTANANNSVSSDANGISLISYVSSLEYGTYTHTLHGRVGYYHGYILSTAPVQLGVEDVDAVYTLHLPPPPTLYPHGKTGTLADAPANTNVPLLTPYSTMHYLTTSHTCQLRSTLSTRIVLRLLPYFTASYQERFFFDMLALVRVQHHTILVDLTGVGLDGNVLATSSSNVGSAATGGVEGCLADWAVCLFMVLCDIVEESSAAHVASNNTDSSTTPTNHNNSNDSGSNTTSARYDLCTKLYATLLSHTLRTGGDTAVHTLEYICALSQTHILGDAVLRIVLSFTLLELVECGTVPLAILEGGVSSFSLGMSSNASAPTTRGINNDSNPITHTSSSATSSTTHTRNRALKESARIVTSSFGSNGSKEMDFRSAVKQWRFLRHLTAVIVCLICKTGFGVQALLQIHPHEDEDTSGNVKAGSASSTSTPERSITPTTTPLHSALHLSSTILTLLDAFIFPDEDGLLGGEMDAMVYGLTLVKPSEPRIGTHQGPLLASLLHLSLLLLAYTIPSSLKFREATSRLRCLFHWALEVIRETCVVGIGSSSAGMGATAFHKLTKILDGLVVGVVLVCHRSLYRIDQILSQMEEQQQHTTSEGMNSVANNAALMEEHRQKRRLFLSAMELREIILEAFRRRSEVLREALSLQAYEALQAALEDQARGNTARRRASLSDIPWQVKEEGIRRFMRQDWVQSFHDVVYYSPGLDETSSTMTNTESEERTTLPCMVSNGQIYKNHTSTTRGRETLLTLHIQTEQIINEYQKVLTSGAFETYLQHQRLWKGDSDGVRALEHTGDICAQNLLLTKDTTIVHHTYSRQLRYNLRQMLFLIQHYAVFAQRFYNVLYTWSMHHLHRSNRYKFAQYTDTLFRRIVLVPDVNPVQHEDHRYDKSLGTGTVVPETALKVNLAVVLQNPTMVEEDESESEDEDEDGDVQHTEGEEDETLEGGRTLSSHTVGGNRVARRGSFGYGNSRSVRAVMYEEGPSPQIPTDKSEGLTSKDLQAFPESAPIGNNTTVKTTIQEEPMAIASTSHQATSTKEQAPLHFPVSYLYPNERMVHTNPYTTTRITLQYTIEGELYLTTHAIYFYPTGEPVSVMARHVTQTEGKHAKKAEKLTQVQIWRLDRLSEMLGRRYLMRQQALELFSVDNRSVLFYFPSGREYRDEVYNKIRTVCHVPLLRTLKDKRRVLTPRQVYKRSTALTNLWRKRRISNFDYLMQLNVLSGRSFNDITQYPVFPWVLSDYESNTIDLTDPAVYRDLRKPIGALNPTRLEMLIERYNDLDGFGDERFLYGSHYSSPGVVLHYLIRQEPFTSMAVELQSGRFDVPDRLFFDIAQCWRGCMNSTSDVKELVPEFYTCPEVFLNTNNLPLGKMQDGRAIDNVLLPPWAHGSAYEFVRIHRAALESEYVTQHLHHWIDLVFGYKQRGPAAITANNLFHPLSYEGAVDFDADTSLDEVDRMATEAHIQNFGQTPSQLILHDPHPARYSSVMVLPLSLVSSLIPNDEQKITLNSYRPPRQYGGKRTQHGPIVNIFAISDTVYAIHADLTVATYKWAPKQQSGSSGSGAGGIFPFTWKNDKLRPLFTTSNSSEQQNQNNSSPAACCARIYTPVEPGSATSGGSLLMARDGDTLGTFGSKSEGSRESIIPPYLYRYDGTPNQLCVGLVRGGPSSSSYLISSGYFDDTLKIHALENAKCESTILLNNNHHNPLPECSFSTTVLTIDTVDNSFIATGSTDGAIRVWCFDNPPLAAALTDAYVQTWMGVSTSGMMSSDKTYSTGNLLGYSSSQHAIPGSSGGSTNATSSGAAKSGVALQLLHILIGHSAPISCLAMNSDLDIIVSGSANGIVCIHSIRMGTFIRSIRFENSSTGSNNSTVQTVSVRRLALSSLDGTIVIHLSDGRLITCTVNGVVLASIGCSDNIICMHIIPGENGQDDILLTGGEAGVLYFRSLHSLQLKHTIDISYHGPVQCMAFTGVGTENTSADVLERQYQQFLFVGSDDGMISIIANPNPSSISLKK